VARVPSVTPAIGPVTVGLALRADRERSRPAATASATATASAITIPSARRDIPLNSPHRASSDATFYLTPAAARCSPARAPFRMFSRPRLPSVARVLEHPLRIARHRNRKRPRAIPGGRIADRGSILENVWSDAGVTLDEMQVFARATELVLSVKVDRIDDERVAFPASDRIAAPWPIVPCGRPSVGMIRARGSFR
jgi:hypothetical protein